MLQVGSLLEKVSRIDGAKSVVRLVLTALMVMLTVVTSAARPPTRRLQR